ncbi:MAG: periplasmic heavy metal sensor [Desulfomonilaceae bacterium]|nr:periplasmic heavy metal sensor [Desulfomonilaceae bacterium]
MNRSVLIVLLVFSLAVNAATAGSLIFFWATAKASPGEISVGRKPMKQFLEEDLGLTPGQLSEVLGIIDEKKPEIIEMKRRFDLTRDEMRALIAADRVDRGAVMEKVQEINSLHGRIRTITVGTVARIAETLPPNAGNTFARYIHDCGPGTGACAPGKGKGPYGDVKPGRGANSRDSL